jgi:hypothetical protein
VLIAQVLTIWSNRHSLFFYFFLLLITIYNKYNLIVYVIRLLAIYYRNLLSIYSSHLFSIFKTYVLALWSQHIIFKRTWWMGLRVMVYVRKMGESMIKHGSSHMMSIYTVHIVAVFIYSYLSLCRFYTDIMMIKYKCVIYVLFSVQCALLESPSLGCDKVCQLNTITLSPIPWSGGITLHVSKKHLICLVLIAQVPTIWSNRHSLFFLFFFKSCPLPCFCLIRK